MTTTWFRQRTGSGIQKIATFQPDEPRLEADNAVNLVLHLTTCPEHTQMHPNISNLKPLPHLIQSLSVLKLTMGTQLSKKLVRKVGFRIREPILQRPREFLDAPTSSQYPTEGCFLVLDARLVPHGLSQGPGKLPPKNLAEKKVFGSEVAAQDRNIQRLSTAP